MSNNENYKKVTDRYDVLSIMDYMLTNLTVVSSDWMNYNVGWWRGLNPEGEHKKWGYILWDNDATFDYYINYSGVPNTNPDAKACDINDISIYMDEFFPLDTTVVMYEADSFFWEGEWIHFPGDTFEIYPDLGKHEKIFLKLLEENSEFRNLYFARYADHLNKVFSCENMNKVLDSLLAIIEPEMPRHIDRWGRSFEEWQDNVEILKAFVNERCNLIDDGLVECYEITGPHNIHIVTQPPNINAKINFNTLKDVSLPYNANYFGNMKNSAVAHDFENYKFIGWQCKEGNIVIDNPNEFFTTLTINNSDTLVAVYQDQVSTKDIHENNLTLYPNPTSSFITAVVDEKLIDYKIYDVNTKIITNTKSSLNGDKLSVDISNLENGLYILEVFTLNKSNKNKFMVIK
jgi:hypothetical protein